MEKSGPSYTAGGNIKCSFLGKQFSSKVWSYQRTQKFYSYVYTQKKRKYMST